MSIFVITHKAIECLPLEEYKLIQVGAHNKEHYCKISDDTGDNISEKNKNYCELTGFYWIWKNQRDDYVGIVHYRRFFTESFFESRFIRERRIKQILKKYDVILPIKTKLNNTTVRRQFLENTGTEDDLRVLESALSIRHPEYLETYNKIFDSEESYYRNMVITSKQIFDKYCEWLFDILEMVEQQLDVENYDDYHKRIYGFLAERLLGVYIEHNGYKVFEVGVVQTDLKQNPVKRFAKRWQRIGYSIFQR